MCFREVVLLAVIYEYLSNIFIGGVSIICMKKFDGKSFSKVIVFTEGNYETVAIDGINTVDCVVELYDKTYKLLGNNNILEYR